MPSDFSEFSQNLPEGFTAKSKKVKCPNCGYPDLKQGEICPFCKTYFSPEGGFAKIGDEAYPKYADTPRGVCGGTLAEDHQRLEYLKKLAFKRGQIKRVSILGAIVFVQIIWLIFR